MTSPKISAIVLIGGKFDKDLLKKCLDSLEWCDEIVKVDTEKVAGSFSQWRDFGAKKAKGDWIFYVDSDEEILPKLAKIVREHISSERFSAYVLPRKNIFLGHEMKWGGWRPDNVLRVIKKNKLKGWYGELHEQPEIIGDIGYINEPIIHRSHRNLTEMVEKTNNWSEIEAKLLYESGHPKMNFFRFFSGGFREAWYRGVIKLGFLDGTVGIIEIIYQTFSRLITYSKLWELQIKSSQK